MPILFSTPDNCSFVKRALRKRLSTVKSTHLSEVLATALGFRTHAALLATMKAAIADRPMLMQVDEDRMGERLRGLGYGPMVPVDLAGIVRSAELPLAAWREFGNRDKAANERWFKECQRRDIPNVCIRLRTKYAELSWDCISIDPAGEDHLRDDDGATLVRIMFERFRALAKGAPAKPEFFGSAFVGTIDRLSPLLARDIADDFFMRLYSPIAQRAAA